MDKEKLPRGVSARQDAKSVTYIAKYDSGDLHFYDSFDNKDDAIAQRKAREEEYGMPKSRKLGEDLTGKRFGKLTVVKYSHNNGFYKIWECKCDCGNTAYVPTGSLKNGNTKSCGCYRTVHSTNTSTGYTGVTKLKNSYKAALVYKGRSQSKSGFDSAEEAFKFRMELKNRLVYAVDEHERKMLWEEVKNFMANLATEEEYKELVKIYKKENPNKKK